MQDPCQTRPIPLQHSSPRTTAGDAPSTLLAEPAYVFLFGHFCFWSLGAILGGLCICLSLSRTQLVRRTGDRGGQEWCNNHWGPQAPFAFLLQMRRAVGTIWLACLQLEREKHVGSAAAQEEAECDGIDDDHHMKEVGLGMNQSASN